MSIAGVRAYAKCGLCDQVCWTDDARDQDDVELHEAVVCRCGSLLIDDSTISGPVDSGFSPSTLEDLINGS